MYSLNAILSLFTAPLENYSSSFELFSFSYHRKVLDVTTTMRYTNIPNNAKLEMIKRAFPRKATNVNVALQTDFDQRLQHEFSPSLTLYEILKHWESHSEG